MNEITKPNMAKALRSIGAFALIAATLIFLFQGGFDLNKLSSIYLFLGLNGAVCSLALLAHYTFKESKSSLALARLGLAIIPVSFAGAGAVLFNNYTPESEIFLIGVTFALPICVFSLPLLAFVPYLLKISGDSEIKKNALILVAGSLCLLVPTRSSFWVPLLASVPLSISALAAYKSDEKTALFPKAAALLPVVIILGRNFFHENDSIYFSFLSAITCVFFFSPPNWAPLKKEEITSSRKISSLFAMAAIYFALKDLHFSFLTNCMFLITGLCLLGAAAKEAGSFFRGLATSVFIIFTFAVLLKGGLQWRILGLCSSIALSLLGWQNKEAYPSSVGAFGLLFGAIFLFSNHIKLPDLDLWKWLALGGLICLISGLIVEKNWSWIITGIKDIRKRFKENI